MLHMEQKAIIVEIFPSICLEYWLNDSKLYKMRWFKGFTRNSKLICYGYYTYIILLGKQLILHKIPNQS